MSDGGPHAKRDRDKWKPFIHAVQVSINSIDEPGVVRLGAGVVPKAHIWLQRRVGGWALNVGAGVGTQKGEGFGHFGPFHFGERAIRYIPAEDTEKALVPEGKLAEGLIAGMEWVREFVKVECPACSRMTPRGLREAGEIEKWAEGWLEILEQEEMDLMKPKTKTLEGQLKGEVKAVTEYRNPRNSEPQPPQTAPAGSIPQFPREFGRVKLRLNVTAEEPPEGRVEVVEVWSAAGKSVSITATVIGEFAVHKRIVDFTNKRICDQDYVVTHVRTAGAVAMCESRGMAVRVAMEMARDSCWGMLPDGKAEAGRMGQLRRWLMEDETGVKLREMYQASHARATKKLGVKKKEGLGEVRLLTMDGRNA